MSQKIKLNPIQPYNFQLIINKIINTPQHRVIYRFEDKKVMRTINYEGETYLIYVSADENKDDLGLKVEIITKQGEVEKNTKIIPIIRHMFGVDIEMDDFYENLKKDKLLETSIHPFKGLRIVQDPNLVEAMVNIIIGQQLNLKFAATLTERLIAYAGDTFEYKNKTFPVYPTTEQLANLTVQELRELQFSQRKAEYIIDFAKNVIEGKLDLNQLHKLSNEEVIEYLIKFRGIGRWSAENLLLFGLGRIDVLPAADIGLKNAVKKLYGLSEKPNEEDLRELGKKWSPWSSYVTYFLWEYLSSN